MLRKIKKETTHKWHCQLNKEGSLYCSWHKNPVHKHVHWGIFFVVLFAVTLISYNSATAEQSRAAKLSATESVQLSKEARQLEKELAKLEKEKEKELAKLAKEKEKEERLLAKEEAKEARLEAKEEQRLAKEEAKQDRLEAKEEPQVVKEEQLAPIEAIPEPQPETEQLLAEVDEVETIPLVQETLPEIQETLEPVTQEVSEPLEETITPSETPVAAEVIQSLEEKISESIQEIVSPAEDTNEPVEEPQSSSPETIQQAEEVTLPLETIQEDQTIATSSETVQTAVVEVTPLSSVAITQSGAEGGYVLSATTNSYKEKTPTSTRSFTLLKRGSVSVEVKELQKVLNMHTGSSLVNDGIFGPLTENVVKKFQKAKGLIVDGIIGIKTLAALNALQ